MGTGAGGDYWEEPVESDGSSDEGSLDPADTAAPLRNPLGLEGAVLPKGEAQVRHIFRPDHLIEDNPETRERIVSYTKGDDHFRGWDEERGHLWYADKDVSSDQFWVEVRGRVVKDAGINEKPRPYSKRTGLRSDPRENGTWRGGRK